MILEQPIRPPLCMPPTPDERWPTSLVHQTETTIGDMHHVFADEGARLSLPPEGVVYSVQSIRPVPEGTEGGLFCGVTLLMPGRVGDEYFMTRGHFHARRNRAEFYWCIEGQGMLLLMDEDRRCRCEPMRPGSLHYIPGHTAHRAVNTGHGVLAFSACWPSDAGHDHTAITLEPFPVRVFCVGSEPSVVEAQT